MAAIFVYQIRSYYTKQQDLDASALLLDNSSNERPDWYEYWPIRKFLLNEALNENAFYGFLSPKFKQKTNLRLAAAREFVQQSGSAADVVLLSPSIHLTAYYWNVFLFGEACHPGLLSTAKKFFERIGEPTDLENLVTHSRNEVHSNYIFAKPRFWRAWLQVTEQLVAFAESTTDPLGAELRKHTTYRGHTDAQVKIFLLERIPTWLLARDASFVARVRDPFVARSRIYKLPGAIVCDALKIAYLKNSEQASYRDVFTMVSKLRYLINWLVRIGDLAQVGAVRDTLSRLASYWAKAGGI